MPGATLAAALLLAAVFAFACGESSGQDREDSPTPGTPLAATPPAASPSPFPAQPGFDYLVEPGDTLFDIARKFGVTLEEIVAANGIEDPAMISAGQMLRIAGAAFTPTPTPANPAGTGFTFPIRGACLPTSEYLMPNAPREYRAGIHEGLDFYTYDNCTEVPAGTPVLAAKAGKVVRTDHDFPEMTAAELAGLLARTQRQGYTDEQALDRFRGRQVWIDHGGGVVTRYCHLGGIPAEVRVGSRVDAAEVIGFVGESGTPEAVTSPGVEAHLHFEVRVGDSFLGKGLPPEQVRWLYERLFSGGQPLP